jgi:hypothetical protein
LPDGQITSSIQRLRCRVIVLQRRKIFLFIPTGNQSYNFRRPVAPEGRFAIVINAGRDVVDAKAATDERGCRVRQKRVVLTPRCWRQVCEKQTLLRDDGGKKAGRRGERAISRKTIAQGMSDRLR